MKTEYRILLIYVKGRDRLKDLSIEARYIKMDLKRNKIVVCDPS
jgi:hypothetical protein